MKMNCCPDDSNSVDDQTPKFRKCTDVFWLLVFVIFLICMVLVAITAFVYGNPLLLIRGYDSFGNICGYEYNENIPKFIFSGINMIDKEYLFFMDENILGSLQICVKQCPDININDIYELKDFSDRTGSYLCRYDLDFNSSQKLDIPLNTVVEPYIPLNSVVLPCPLFPIHKSVPVLNHCIPQDKIYLLNQNRNFIKEVFEDWYKSWKWTPSLIIFSFLFSIFLMGLVHLIKNVASWIIIISASTSFVAGLSLFIWTYIDIKCKLDSELPERILDDEINNEDLFKWYSISTFIFTLVVLLMVLSMRKKINFVVTLFEESSNCLSQLPTLYFQPILSFLLLLLFYISWINVIFFLVTASFPEPYHTKFSVSSNFSLHYNLTEVRYEQNNVFTYLLIIHIFGLFWISEFILACQHIVVAGTVAKWYFSRNHKESKRLIATTLGNLICYHLGSVALGSFIIMFMKIPRILLTFVHNKLRTNKENSKCAQHGLKFCLCCTYCLDKFIRYMNHNAYTVVAIQGINFCPAACRAWKVFADNTLRLTSMNAAGNLILFLAKSFVVAITIIVAVIIFKYDQNLHFYAASVLLIGVFAYFVSNSVISLHELIMDTLFLCMSEDQLMNGNEGHWKTMLLAKIEFSGIKPQKELPEPTVL